MVNVDWINAAGWATIGFAEVLRRLSADDVQAAKTPKNINNVWDEILFKWSRSLWRSTRKLNPLVSICQSQSEIDALPLIRN